MIYRSKAERNADNLIRKANTQLRSAARVFGTQSPEYAKMEAKVIHAFGGDFDRMMKKDPSTGAVQIRRTKGNLAAVASRPDGKHRSMAGKAVESITKQESVASMQKRLLSDYERRTGRKPKTAEEKRAAASEQQRHVSSLSSTFHANMKALYELEQKLGYPLKAVARIRAMSQGARTDPETLAAMNKIAEDELNAEEHEIDDGYFEFLQDL